MNNFSFTSPYKFIVKNGQNQEGMSKLTFFFNQFYQGTHHKLRGHIIFGISTPPPYY